MEKESVKSGCDEHRYEIVEKNEVSGMWTLCCKKCGELITRAAPRPITESQKQPPLLME